MDSVTRCNSFKYLIIPHKSYYGNLNIEIIINDLNYLKSETKVGYGIYPLHEHIKNVINKLENKNYFCKYYVCNYVSYDVYERKLVYMFLVILDYIVRKISSIKYFKDLKNLIEEELNVRVYYPSMEKPVNNSS